MKLLYLLLISGFSQDNDDEVVDGQSYPMMMGGGFESMMPYGNMGMGGYPPNIGYAMTPMMGGMMPYMGGYGGGYNDQMGNMGSNYGADQGMYDQGNNYSSSTAWDRGSSDVNSQDYNQGYHSGYQGNQYGANRSNMGMTHAGHMHRRLNHEKPATVVPLPNLPADEVELVESKIELLEKAEDLLDEKAELVEAMGYDVHDHQEDYGGGGGGYYPSVGFQGSVGGGYGGYPPPTNYGGGYPQTGGPFLGSRGGGYASYPGGSSGSGTGGYGNPNYGGSRAYPPSRPIYPPSTPTGNYPPSTPTGNYPPNYAPLATRQRYSNDQLSTGGAIASSILSTIFRGNGY